MISYFHMLYNIRQTKIYHNPQCSKSRQTLELLKSKLISPEVILYLKNTPSKKEIQAILKLLQMEPREILRKKEPEYKEQNLDDQTLNDDEILDAIIATPKLLERPIVVIDNSKAVIARPPEKLLEILN